MLTAEQLAARKVGGSDVATILGLNPYKTPLELYAEKRGEIAPEDLDDNEAVEAGNVFEPAIADLSARRLTRKWGKEVKLRRCNLTLVHPKYDWITCHIDRDFVGIDRGLEIKNVGWRMAHLWGPQGTDEIPDYHLPQVHAYLLVKAYPIWTVAAYFGGADLRFFDVEQDKEFGELIVDRTHDFWHNHVLKGVPPTPDDFTSVAAITRALKRVYPGTDGTTLTASEADEHYYATLLDAQAIANAHQELADGAKNHLLWRMKNAAVLKFADGRQLTRKVVPRKAFTVEATTYLDARFAKSKE